MSLSSYVEERLLTRRNEALAEQAEATRGQGEAIERGLSRLAVALEYVAERVVTEMELQRLEKKNAE